MVVMKFGGTSVGDPAAIRRVAAIVRRERRPRIVVVSALARVTDGLLQAAGLAAGGDGVAACAALHEIQARHRAVAASVAGTPSRPALERQVDEVFAALDRALSDLLHAGALDPRLLDAVLVHGELLSSLIAAAAMQEAGVRAVWVNACDVIVTDAEHTSATADLPRTTENAERLLRPLLRSDRVPVLGGFIGSTSGGVPATLGRGGSDVSAAVLGGALGAEEIQIWTDVDGMMTADPRLVRSALPVGHLSYAEALDLACFGAKVLHPGTVGPAVDRRIPLRILNSWQPDLPGTRIDHASPSRRLPLTALACKDGIAVVEIKPRHRRDAKSFPGSVLDTVRELKLNVMAVTASEAAVSLALEKLDSLDESIGALSRAGEIMTHRGLALVCLVGDNLRANGHLANQVLEEVRNLAPVLIAQPATRCLTVALPREHLREAVNRLHERFFALPHSRPAAPARMAPAAGLQAG